jgi:hypothetical protein
MPCRDEFPRQGIWAIARRRDKDDVDDIDVMPDTLASRTQSKGDSMTDESLKRGREIKLRLQEIQNYIAALEESERDLSALEICKPGRYLVATVPAPLRNTIRILLKSAYQSEAEALQKEFDKL